MSLVKDEVKCEPCDSIGWVCEHNASKPWGGASSREDACDCEGCAADPCMHCNASGKMPPGTVVDAGQLN